MTLIDFRQLWMFDTVVESCENIARRETVLSDFTSSRFIDSVNRRCWFQIVYKVEWPVIGNIPKEFCNSDHALHANLRSQSKWETLVGREIELRLLKSYTTYFINAVSWKDPSIIGDIL